MTHRTGTILLAAALICLSASVTPLEAAVFPSGAALQSRIARLQRHGMRSAASAPRSRRAVSSSSRSASSVGWEVLRMNKRRGGGGGGGQPQTSSAGSSRPRVTPSVTFGNIVKDFGSANFTLSPVSESDGAYLFLSNNPSVASVSGNTVTVGNAGSATITLEQAPSGNFDGATVNATLTVRPIAPTIVALLSISKTTIDAPFMLSDPLSDSAGAFTFTSTNPAVATVTGRTVLITGAGTTTIVSTQAANGNYTSGSGVTTLTVSPALEEA